MIKGNKGEWSELYVLLRLLADGKLYAADETLRKMESVYFPILSVFRQEFEAGKIEYKVDEKHKSVELYYNGDKIKALPASQLKGYAEKFLGGIVSRRDKKLAFYLDGADEIMQDIHCTKIKAPSSDKTDIQVKIHDIMTGHQSVVGYSIKSDLGMPPTLLNPGKTTNFRFTVSGISDIDAVEINNINTSSKLIDRFNRIKELGGADCVQFDCVNHPVFAGNLLMIDTNMDRICADMLIEYFFNRKNSCADIATAIEEKDILGYGREGLYRYKIKKLLYAVALGMRPATPWDGQDEANGGYIIVKESGDVVAFHLYNRNEFEKYLFNNTRLDTSSSSRYDYGSLYKVNGKMCINLNLQIRFC